MTVSQTTQTTDNLHFVETKTQKIRDKVLESINNKNSLLSVTVLYSFVTTLLQLHGQHTTLKQENLIFTYLYLNNHITNVTLP
jgi:hypothetical protein